MKNGSHLFNELTESQINEIQSLEKNQREANGIAYKIDPEALQNSSQHKSKHILHYEEGALAAYMVVDCFSSAEREVAAVIHDNEAAFIELLQMAAADAKQAGIEKILLIVDRNDAFVAGLAKRLGLTYSFTEYRMNLVEQKLDMKKTSGLVIRQAVAADIEEIAALDNVGFGQSGDGAEMERPDAADVACTKMAVLDGKTIGKLRVYETDGIYGIYGFVVDPACRGKGYGREILGSVIASIAQSGYSKIYLEVSAVNPSALHLYETCGFATEAVFDYYEQSEL